MASADSSAPAPGLSRAARVRAVPAIDADSHRFMIGLTCAALLHAMLIAAAFRAAPRMMGEKDGSPEGISVEVMDEADYLSRTTLPPEQPSPPPPTVSQQPVPPAPLPQPPQPPAQPAAETVPEPAPVQKKPATTPTIDDSGLPGLLSLPKQPSDKASKQPDALEKHEGSGIAASPSKPNPKPKPDLAMPAKPPQFNFVPLSATVARPAGITRSGENDDFGRGVIRALRQTMPPHRRIYGRVTIRLLLNESGNLAEVQVIGASTDASLDQSVLFASKQSSFPLPPKGATVADRTFLVTYIYN